MCASPIFRQPANGSQHDPIQAVQCANDRSGRERRFPRLVDRSAIIGAGPAGLWSASAAADAGLAVTLIERQPRAPLADPAPDGRDIALTHRSEAILRDLGIWELFPPPEIAPLREARVSNGGSRRDALLCGNGGTGALG
ncbi:MAG: FAD-dependent monooxygenase [Burkholderiaceae bacterium]